MKAVVFDMDGVLFDTEIVCMKAWMAVAERRGLSGMEEIFNQVIGLNANDSRLIVLKAYGEDFDYIDVTGETPRGAEFAVRIRGDSMEPYIHDGSIAYVNRDPLVSGDVGIFCVDGEMLCKQYVQDGLGMVYLFSLNRARADADVFLPRDSGRSMVCFGRVLLASRPRVPRR